MPSTIPGTSFHLVACLVDGKPDFDENGYIFCDAMGMAMALKHFGVSGTFLSCFDLDGYMAWLSTEKGIKKIAFGMTGPDKKPIFGLDDFRIASRDNFFTYVEPKKIKKRVLEWIKFTASKAVPGDVVNIVLESHGKKVKGLLIGEAAKNVKPENWLSPQEVAEVLKRFADGVQVNVVNGACYSGEFVDVIRCDNPQNRWITASCTANQKAFSSDRSISGRMRGSRYEMAWVQSLARLPIPGITSSLGVVPNLTIEAHEAWIRENLHIGFSSAPQTPQCWTSCSDSEAVIHMLVRDKIDHNYDPTTTSRRRRIEWPDMNQDIRGIISPIGPEVQAASPAATKSAKDLLDDYVWECQPCQAPEDRETFDPKHFPFNTPKRIADALKLLYYRARQQSTIHDVFQVLQQKGFVGLKGLCRPYDYHTTSDANYMLRELIGCFEYCYQEEYTDFNEKPCPMWHADNAGSYKQWLATMIIRDPYASDNYKSWVIFEVINACLYLGPVNAEALAAWKDTYPSARWRHDPNDCVFEHQQPIFGWLLPRNIGETADHDTLMQGSYDAIVRFNRIERVFKEYFNVPDDQICLEHQQAAYLDDNKENGVIKGPMGEYLRKEAAYRRASDARIASGGGFGLPHSTSLNEFMGSLGM